MKNQNGITLIALVITIIVLLILAGVAIAMLSGDNGILSNATKSSDYNKIGEVKDKMALTVNEYVAAFLDYKHNEATFPTDIPASDVTAMKADGVDASGVVTIAINSYKAAGSNVGNLPDGVTVTGTGTDADKLTITSGDYKVEGTTGSNGVTWGNIIDK